MSAQHQTTPNTKSGSSESALQPPPQTELKTPKTVEKIQASIRELDDFRDRVAQFDDLPKDTDKVPCIAVSRGVIQHFVRKNDLPAFDSVGFFMYHGVKVYEKGHPNLAAVLKEQAA